MWYRFKKKQNDGTWMSGTVHSVDGEIVSASPIWKDFVGKKLRELTSQLRQNGFFIYVSDTEHKQGTRC